MEQWKQVCGGSGREEVGSKKRGDIVHFSSYIPIMFTLVKTTIKCHIFL